MIELDGDFRPTMTIRFDIDLIRQFASEVERRAEANMLRTPKLEGMHAALKEVLAEWEGNLTPLTDDQMNQYARPILTVDVALFTLLDRQLHVLLIQRDQEPFLGHLALPGAYVHVNEDVDCTMAAHRVTREKLGIEVGYLEQLCTFSGIWRDPRGWSASVAHIAVIKESHLTTRVAQEFYPVDNLPTLGFDHNGIIEVAVQRLRNKTNYSSLPLFLMPPKFTINDLRLVYEALLGSEINRDTFRKMIIEQGIIEPTGEKEVTKLHRPGELYRGKARQDLAVFRDIR